jgi:hypothetical protein
MENMSTAIVPACPPGASAGALPVPAGEYEELADSRAAQMLSAAEALYGPTGAASLQRGRTASGQPLQFGLRPEFDAAEQERYLRQLEGAWQDGRDGLPLSRRRQQAVRAALVYAAQLLHADGQHQRVQAAGLTTALEDALIQGFEDEVVELQQLAMLAELYDSELLAKLARGRIAAMMMTADSAQEWWLLSRALKTLPQWVLSAGQAETLAGHCVGYDHAQPHPEFDYPASDSAAIERLAARKQPLNRSDRRRIQAMLKREARARG